MSVNGADAPVTHHVTGLITFVNVAYVPAVPPLQPVKLVEVLPVQVTVPEEPKEIVLFPVLNLEAEATEIVAAGKVTALDRVVEGTVGQ